MSRLPPSVDGPGGYLSPDWFNPESRTGESPSLSVCRACGHAVHGAAACAYTSHDGNGVVVCGCREE